MSKYLDAIPTNILNFFNTFLRLTSTIVTSALEDTAKILNSTASGGDIIKAKFMSGGRTVLAKKKMKLISNAVSTTTHLSLSKLTKVGKEM